MLRKAPSSDMDAGSIVELSASGPLILDAFGLFREEVDEG